MASRFVRSIKNVKNIKNYPVDDNITEINDIINDEAGNVYIRTEKSYDKLNNGKDVEDVKNKVEDVKNKVEDVKNKVDQQEKTIASHQKQLNSLDSENINEMKEKLDQIDVNTINQKLESVDTLNTKVKDIDTLNTKVKEIDTLNTKVKDIDTLNTKVKEIDTLNTKVKEIDTLSKKVNNIYQLTDENGNRKLLSSVNDIKALQPGFYEFATGGNQVAMGLPEDIGDSIVELDVYHSKEGGRKQFYATKSSNNTSWQKTIHTNGQENDWKQVVK